MSAHYYRYMKWPAGMKPKNIVRLKETDQDAVPLMAWDGHEFYNAVYDASFGPIYGRDPWTSPRITENLHDFLTGLDG